MSPALWPLAVAVAGTVGYHLFQKSVPGDAAPAVVIGVAYLIGLSALVIEAGVLLAYRAGWPLSTASLVSNVTVAVVLLAVGLAVYGEALTGRQWLGAALCGVGLMLLTAR